jgi:hypothetical protein
MTTVHVLRLQEGRFYVGEIDDVIIAFQDRVPEWTALYKPIYLERILVVNTLKELNHIVVQYMAIHGIDMVRGGSYLSPILPDTIRYSLEKEIRIMKNLCALCGGPDHHEVRCTATVDVTGQTIAREICLCMHCKKVCTSRTAYRLHHYVCQLSTQRLTSSDVVSSIRHMVQQIEQEAKENAKPRCYKCGYVGHHVVNCCS